MSDQDDGLIVPVQNIAAAHALELVQQLIKDDAGRQAYKADPGGAFEAKKDDLPDELQHLRDANYSDIPAASAAALEALMVEHLELLSNLDQTFVEDGLYVQVPSPGKLFYK